jgi:hypothetical protein
MLKKGSILVIRCQWMAEKLLNDGVRVVRTIKRKNTKYRQDSCCNSQSLLLTLNFDTDRKSIYNNLIYRGEINGAYFSKSSIRFYLWGFAGNWD